MTEDLTALRRHFGDVASARIGTIRGDGGPHVATRWFVWLEDGLWVATRMGDATWEHALGDPRVSIVIDQGRDWRELTGVRVEGVAELMPAEHPDMREPMSAWHEKYRSFFSVDGFERFAQAVPALGFVHVLPSRVEAWNHAANPTTWGIAGSESRS
jgi:hypothetical protein